MGKLAIGLGQLELAVVEDRRQRRGHLDAGESRPQALMGTPAPGREDVGTPVFIAGRAMPVDVEALRLGEAARVEVTGGPETT